MITASLTVCQSQANSAATSVTVRPPPTWQRGPLGRPGGHKHFLAAMRWSESIQVFLAQRSFTQRIRCFFQASDIGVP